MPHQIDWTNTRGMLCIEQRIGPRHCARVPQIGPIIFDLMESIGQFQLATIERELRSRGWAMTTHSLTVRDIKSIIWFVNASDQSGYWCEQFRFTKEGNNTFIWRVQNCGLMQKEQYWLMQRNHAARSVPKTLRPATTFEAIVEPIDGALPELIETPAQSIELDLSTETIRDNKTD